MESGSSCWEGRLRWERPSNLNTSGRRELWSPLVASCNKTWLIGEGLGTSNQLSREYTDGRIGQPHNEYLRIYCDTGLVGSFLFWGALAAVGIRALQVFRRDPEQTMPVSALLFVATFLVLSITDNVLTAPCNSSLLL